MPYSKPEGDAPAVMETNIPNTVNYNHWELKTSLKMRVFACYSPFRTTHAPDEYSIRLHSHKKKSWNLLTSNGPPENPSLCLVLKLNPGYQLDISANTVR